jgi:hypothetical protein
MKLRVPRVIWIAVPTFVLVVVSLGLAIGFPIYRYLRAVTEIERRGGWVRTRDGGPSWLRPWIKDEHMKVFDQAFHVECNGAVFNDGDAPNLAELKELEELAFVNLQITDAGLASLQGLARLN